MKQAPKIVNLGMVLVLAACGGGEEAPEATTEEAPRRRTVGGRLRAAIGRTTLGQRLLRRDVLQKDWDLNVLGRCVALRKDSNDERATHWDSDF